MVIVIAVCQTIGGVTDKVPDSLIQIISSELTSIPSEITLRSAIGETSYLTRGSDWRFGDMRILEICKLYSTEIGRNSSR